MFPSPDKAAACLDKASLIKINSLAVKIICNNVSASLAPSSQ